MRLKANSILENIVASIILLILFVIAGNALNQVFKTAVNGRDLKFDNEVKEMEYLIIHKKKETPQLIELGGKSAQFTQEKEVLKLVINKKGVTKKTVCCIDKK